MPAARPSPHRPVVHRLGVRHHGPGSARSVVSALDELQPHMVLVEAPADATSAFRWIGHPELVPPVALLGHVADRPQRAVFSPFASFSPEWRAVLWANHHGVEVRGIDLPHSITLATSGDPGGDRDALFDDAAAPIDPLAELAVAAGEPDAERWWDDVVEHRGDGVPAFDAVAEAMAAVRLGTSPSATEARREAHMRRAIRTAVRDLAKAASDHAATEPSIAVVCGAWHVPALDIDAVTATSDAAVLRGLPKVKVGVSWVPWTHRRLASAGYGAGVRSPGWYDHVFRHPGTDGVARFVVDAAHVLRAAGLSASPDHLVSATRLADSLAVLRGRPRAGLDEVLDAADAVMGGLPLVRDQLVIGHAIGSVPEGAPQVPLARDLAAQQRRVRLKVTDEPKVVELDLRTANGLARSHLLHRLDALGVTWGALEEGRGSSGTFRETWRVRWEPEMSVRLVELAGYGTTVEGAATARLVERARSAAGLGVLATLVDVALLADLDDAVGPVVSELSTRAAGDPDLGGLMDALVPLARSMRYGDVRSTDARALRDVFDGLVVRVLAGVVAACRSLDDDAAAVMTERLSGLQASLALVDHPARRTGVVEVLERLSDPLAPVHGLVQGRATRLLHDGGHGHPDEVGRRLGRALSAGTPPASGARFVEGFLAGSGTVLVHDVGLRELVDRWVSSLTIEAFTDVVPLLRRTFGAFEAAERRQLGQLVAGRAGSRPATFGDGIDPDRALLAVGTVRAMLGLPELPDRTGLPELSDRSDRSDRSGRSGQPGSSDVGSPGGR
jgi:hypothetical protein